MALTASHCFEQAAEQLRKADDPNDRRDVAIRMSLSEAWRLLGVAVRGEEPDVHVDTVGQVERAEGWDHDQRVPVGFGRA